jgi:hypothetical protein
VWHVRVAVQRDAVRRAGDDPVERRREPSRRLPRQPVDQVDVHRREALRPCGVDHQPCLRFALHAVDRELNRGIEVLDAHRHAVEPQRGQERDGRGVDLARIDLDRDLGARIDREPRAQRPHQRRHLVPGQEGRRAAAPVQLLDVARALQQVGDGLDLAADVADVFGRAAVILGDHLVARAVVADGVAERHVHVQRKRLVGPQAIALLQRIDVVVGGECPGETVRGRVRGVTRPVAVVLADQRGIELQRRGCRRAGDRRCFHGGNVPYSTPRWP